MSEPSPEQLKALAGQAAGNPFFLASAMRDFAHAWRLSDDALARLWNIDLATLYRLSLCRRPRVPTDYVRLARHYGVSEQVLQLLCTRVSR